MTTDKDDRIRKHYEKLRQRAQATWDRAMAAETPIANGNDFWPRTAANASYDRVAAEAAIDAAYHRARADYPGAVAQAAHRGQPLPTPPVRSGTNVYACPDIEACVEAARRAWEEAHARAVAEFELYRLAVAQGVAVPPPEEEVH